MSQGSLTDWSRIDMMRDEDIDLADAPEVTEEMLRSAEWRLGGKRIPKDMRVVTIALDGNVIEYFKAHAGDRAYWELINDVLKDKIREEDLEDLLRRVIREEIQTAQHDVRQSAQLPNEQESDLVAK